MRAFRNYLMLTVAWTAIAAPATFCQSTGKLPEFDVASIKPHDPNTGGIAGFLAFPGGRIVVGAATVKMILYYAFDIRESQIMGGPDWIGSDRYDVVALSPAAYSGESQTKLPPHRATPSEQQRGMLQALLADRFGLKYHRETRQASVYILSKGKNKLQMVETQDKEQDPRGGLLTKSDGTADGEMFGKNMSMDLLARRLSADLDRPVLDRTGLAGSYDFHLAPFDPTNRDVPSAIVGAANRLGLKLKAGKGPIDVIVVDSVTRPTPN
jgi:uncharacterized protein (TIGR03435 family)